METPENNDAGFAVLAHKVDAIHTDVNEMRVVLRDLTNAIIKLALVEERQSQFAIAQERSFKVLEKLEAKLDDMDHRIRAIEVAEPEQKRTSGWVTTAVWTCAGLLGLILLRKLGIAL